MHALFKGFSIDAPMRASRSLREGLLLERAAWARKVRGAPWHACATAMRWSTNGGVEEVALALAKPLEASGARSTRAAHAALGGAAARDRSSAQQAATIIATRTSSPTPICRASASKVSCISALVGAHRRVLDEAKLSPLRQVDGERAVRVAALLRLAVRINRGLDLPQARASRHRSARIWCSPPAFSRPIR